MRVFQALKGGAKYLYTDPMNLILGFIPVLLCGLLYGYVGKWALLDVRNTIQDKIQAFLGFDTKSLFLGPLIFILLFVITIFFINWTFYLFASILASPFNDVLSGRVERLMLGKSEQGAKESLNVIIRKFFKTIWSETKKIIFLLFLSTAILCINLFPFLMPLSFFLSAILVAISFLDYTWSRHDLSFYSGLKNVKINFWTYLPLGIIFLFFLSIPIINVFVIPLGVSTFTVAFLLKN